MKTKKHIMKAACKGKGGTANRKHRYDIQKKRGENFSATLANYKPYITPKKTVGVVDVAKEIPGTIKGMYGNARKAVDPGDISGAIGRGVGTLVNKGKEKAKKLVKERIQAQKNWENRPDDSNKYGNWTDFKDK